MSFPDSTNTSTSPVSILLNTLPYDSSESIKSNQNICESTSPDNQQSSTAQSCTESLTNGDALQESVILSECQTEETNTSIINRQSIALDKQEFTDSIVTDSESSHSNSLTPEITSTELAVSTTRSARNIKDGDSKISDENADCDISKTKSHDSLEYRIWKHSDHVGHTSVSTGEVGASSEQQEEEPSLCTDKEWIIWVGAQKKIPIIVFHTCALVNPPSIAVGMKYHMTFKFLQGDSKLLNAVLLNHGFREADPDSQDFNILWTFGHPQTYMYQALTIHQRINHFPRSTELTRKDNVVRNIERMQRSKGMKHFNFIPQTFVMPADYNIFSTQYYKKRGPWIVKPVAASQGQGIYFINYPDKIPCDAAVVISRYITNPLLINNRKSDLRLYVSVTSYDPLVAYLHEDGFVRFASVEYDTSNQSLWNPCIHLCNYSINKFHSNYIRSENADAENASHKWTLNALLQYLKTEMNADTDRLMSQIKDLIIKVLISGERQISSGCKMLLQKRRVCFELYGFDILIDANLKPWLIEINLSPSLHCDTPLDLKVKSGVLTDLFTLVGVPAVDIAAHRASSLSSAPKIIPTAKPKRIRPLLGKDLPGRRAFSYDQLHMPSNVSIVSKEDIRLANVVREEYDRRGGYERIFPCSDTWPKYKVFFELTASNNAILHELLFGPQKSPASSIILPDMTSSLPNMPFTSENCEPAVIKNCKSDNDMSLQVLKRSETIESAEEKQKVLDKVKYQLKNGYSLSMYQSRKTFGKYLFCLLSRMKEMGENDEHLIYEIANFVKSSTFNVRDPFVMQNFGKDITIEDKAALAARLLHEFLISFNRETEDISTNPKKSLNKEVPPCDFRAFASCAMEADWKEILDHHNNSEAARSIFLGKCGLPTSATVRFLPGPLSRAGSHSGKSEKNPEDTEEELWDLKSIANSMKITSARNRNRH